jgi:hypothetical protein
MPRAYIKNGTSTRGRRYGAYVRGGQAARSGYMAHKRTYNAPTRNLPARVGETKYFDCESTLVGIAAASTSWASTEQDPETTINLGSAPVATPLNLCSPTVGSALNQRVGRDITLKKCKVRGHINVAAQSGLNTADAATYCRVLLVLDTQTNSAQLNAEDVLNAGSAADATINSFMNPNFFGRFKILGDKTIVLADPSLAGEVAGTNVIQSGLLRTFKFNVNLKDTVSRFNATNGGTVADIIDNSLHIIAGTNNQGLSPSLSYYSRVSYKDT